MNNYLNGYNGENLEGEDAKSEDVKSVAKFLAGLNKNEIKKNDYDQLKGTLERLLIDNASFLDKETVRKLDSLLDYVREEEM